MKKLLTIAALSFLLLPASQAFAGDTLSKLSTTNGAILGFTPSNSVKLYYASDQVSNSGNSPQWYVASAKHTGGDRAYGTTAKTNLLVTPQHDDCVGQDSVACAATVGATALTASANGQDNVDGLTNWSIL